MTFPGSVTYLKLMKSKGLGELCAATSDLANQAGIEKITKQTKKKKTTKKKKQQKKKTNKKQQQQQKKKKKTTTKNKQIF